jgi:opacity protein-like surface antigen
MKRVCGLVIGLLVLLFATQVWAQSSPHGMYLSGNIGFGMRPDADITPGPNEFDNDPAFALNGAIGFELNPMFRVEGELGYHFNTADVPGFPQDFTFSAVSFMANAYFDVPTNSPIRPYVGGGLGFASINLEEDLGFEADDSDVVGAFQFMAGIGYDISPRATLTFGYRYFTTSDPDFGLPISGSFETEYSSHDFLFGARFRF